MPEYLFGLNKYLIKKLYELNFPIDNNNNIEGNEHGSTNNKLQFPKRLGLRKVPLNLLINLLTDLQQLFNPKYELLNVILRNPPINVGLIDAELVLGQEDLELLHEGVGQILKGDWGGFVEGGAVGVRGLAWVDKADCGLVVGF